MAHDQISVNALKVVQRLTEAGYEAYLVGGSVRDLILGRLPKDFDIATDAHPEDVYELFRNSRMIGRRFKIVHVRFGREIVEVATFRAVRGDEDPQTDSGMILRDNIYGTFEEDAIRRDFSINAVYYSPGEEKLIDLVGGLDDIEARRIRLIGDPESRYREDPVRMLRAIRFKTKLEFEIDDESGAPMRHLGYLLQDIPPARLFEEILKLFMSGHGAASFDNLLAYDLFGWLFPDSRRAMDESLHAEKLIRAALASTDRRIAEDLPVTPAFIFAALLWYPFISEKKRLETEGLSHLEANHEAAANIIAKQQLFTSIPRRFSGPMRDIWMLQFRLPNRHGKKATLVFGHKRFRAAYDFLLLREEAGENLDGLGAWWTNYQEENPAPERRSGTDPGDAETVPSKRPRRRRRRNRRPVES